MTYFGPAHLIAWKLNIDPPKGGAIVYQRCHLPYIVGLNFVARP